MTSSLHDSGGPDLYERDFYAWTAQQARLLRAGRLDQLDLANIAEEIESMGRSEYRELVNRLVVLLQHLLKWRYQPGLRGTFWRLSIKEQRLRLADHLADNQSLKARFDDAVVHAYRLAVIGAVRETGLAERTFPASCPFDLAQIMDGDFLPGDPPT